MNRNDELVPSKEKSSDQQREESVKKEHQYGSSQPAPQRQATGVDADEDRKTSTDATGGPDKPTA